MQRGRCLPVLPCDPVLALPYFLPILPFQRGPWASAQSPKPQTACLTSEFQHRGLQRAAMLPCLERLCQLGQSEKAPSSREQESKRYTRAAYKSEDANPQDSSCARGLPTSCTHIELIPRTNTSGFSALPARILPFASGHEHSEVRGTHRGRGGQTPERGDPVSGEENLEGH
jgi:hypothetical protein